MMMRPIIRESSNEIMLMTILLAARNTRRQISSTGRCSKCRRQNMSSYSYSSSRRLRFADYYSSLWIQRRCYARYFSNLSNNSGDDRRGQPIFKKEDNRSEDGNYYSKQHFIDPSSGSSSNNSVPPLNVDLQPPNISRVLSILKPEVSSLLLALGALTISTAATLQFPNAIGDVIDILSASGGTIAESADTIVENLVHDNKIIDGSCSPTLTTIETPPPTEQQQLDQIRSISFKMLGFFTVGSVATFYHSTSFETIGQKIGATLRKQLFSTIIHQQIAFFDQNRGGELANRLSTDVHEVAEHLVQNISIFMSNLVRSITAVASMIAISPSLTLYLTPLPIVLGGCAAFYGKFIKHWSKKHLDVLAHSTHMVREIIFSSGVLSFCLFLLLSPM